MPFSEREFCLVCEGVRPELGQKLTILGFYGMAPNVEIVVSQLMAPVQVSFVLGFAAPRREVAEQQHTQHGAIIGPDGGTLTEVPMGPLQVRVGTPIMLAFTLPFVATDTGEHFFRLTMDRDRPIDNRFLIRLPTADELRRFPQPPLQ